VWRDEPAVARHRRDGTLDRLARGLEALAGGAGAAGGTITWHLRQLALRA
jgi:hypothetical protein